MEQEKRVRISVANLCPYIQNKDTRETLAVGIVNIKKLAKGTRQYEALGGGAWMTPKGKKTLEERYQAVFLGEGKDVNDAQFTVPEQHVAPVVEMFDSFSSAFCEIEPLREVKEELEVESIDVECVLKLGDLIGAEYSPLGVFHQEPAEDSVGTSENTSVKIPTRRLFYVHVLIVPDEVFERIVNNKYIRCFDEKELDTTAMGRLIGLTNSGEVMADNLSNYVPGLIYNPDL